MTKSPLNTNITMEIGKNFMSEITQLIKNDKKKLKSILKKLIIKKFLRQYILHCQFKPGGTGYLRSKSHFDMLHRNKM